MRSTPVWKNDAPPTEKQLAAWWPHRINIDSPQPEKQVYVAMEARLGRLFLGKKHDAFQEFADISAIFERFETELAAVRQGKPAPNLTADNIEVAEAKPPSGDGTVRVRFDSSGKAVDEGILLQEAGLLPGTYLKSLLTKPTTVGTLLPSYCCLVELTMK